MFNLGKNKPTLLKPKIEREHSCPQIKKLSSFREIFYNQSPQLHYSHFNPSGVSAGRSLGSRKFSGDCSVFPTVGQTTVSSAIRPFSTLKPNSQWFLFD